MRLIGIAIAAVVAMLAGPTSAQQWPARSVKLLVPYPAGGNVDSAARIIADKLQEKLGQPFIIENKACLLYTSPSPRDGLLSRMPSSA